MFEKIIAYSLKNKLIVLLLVLALILGGIYSMRHLAVDAVPDITNNQVQVVTSSPTLAAEEVEQFITLPIEMAVANIPNVIEVRSISRYGLSVITIVFEEEVDIMLARQFVNEQLTIVKDEIPEAFGSPEMMPITTGLGEIYQYILQVKPGYENQFDIMEIRTIQDWIVKRQLAGIPGIIEVSSFGGLVKQYEVSVFPEKLLAYDISINELEAALAKNNSNSGGSYIESGENAFYLRTEGRASNFEDIENIIIKNEGSPVRIKDVAKVGFGSPKRYGAMTMDGKGEVVGGITLMLKGANSSEAVENVQNRMELVQKALPEGLEVYPYLDRSVLVGKTINTVTKNLIEGGLIVIFVLVLFLGNFRAGLIVSSVIPLSMLFAFILMRYFNVSANLMSLGAIDFGIVVDGAVIIVEGVLHILHQKHRGKTLTTAQMNTEIQSATGQIYRSAAFGVLIILVVFVPIFSLEGVEGKTFLPMAQTVSFAILGSLLLSLTYVPVASALFLNKKISDTDTFSDKMVIALQKRYKPLLSKVLEQPKKVVAFALAGLIGAFLLFGTMGSEFIPTLEEGDLAMQMAIAPGSSLEKSIATSTRAEKILKDNFSEINHVVSKIGTAEVPTDPMAIEDADIIILLKEKDEWENADNREDLIELMKEKLSVITDASFEFTQPIQLRFNELMTGAKTDIAIQIFGEDPATLKTLADKTALTIKDVNGVGDVKVEQTEGLRQLSVVIDRKKLAIHEVNVEEVNQTIKAAYAGVKTGVIYENERHFDLVVRLDEQNIQQLSLNKLFVKNAQGEMVSLNQLAKVEEKIAPMQISREDAKRRITIGVNVRDRDIASLVEELQGTIDKSLKLPAGYTIKYGGQFENLENALNRLMIVVPVALMLILFLLYLAFGTFKESIIIFMAVPLASIGGILALWLRGMPFSISAGIGFIALFGVAVLNGIVLVNEIVKLKQTNMALKDLIIEAANSRLRPVLMTALVASLGFIPMALATSSGAEVQRPLATVVIGGLITSTLLTLLVLPALYLLFDKRKKIKMPTSIVLLIGLLGTSVSLNAQEKQLGLEELVTAAQRNHVNIKLNELEKQVWESESKNAYQIQPLQIGVQHGQNDGELMDTYWEVMQDFGAPWTIKRRKNAAKLGIDFTEQKAQTIQQEIRYNITAAYYNWLFFNKAYELLNEVKMAMLQAEKSLKLKLEAGEISHTDYLMVQQLNNAVKQKMQQYYSGKNQQEQELLFFSGLDGTIKDTLYEKISFQTVSTLSTSLYAENQLKIAQLEQQQKVIKSDFQPTFQAGYFRQSLNHVQGFQGFKAGLAIPLVFGGKRNELAKNRLQIEAAKTENDNLKKLLESELQTLTKNIAFMQQNVGNNQQYFDDTLLGLQQLQQQLTVGEINHYEFVQLTNIIIEGALSEMQMINSFNQAVIKHQFLTTTN